MSVLFLFIHVLCVYVLRPLSGFFDFFRDKFWLFVVKTGWQPCESNKPVH